MKKNTSRLLFICLGLGLGSLFLFWPLRGFEFINYDDQNYVTENLWVQNGLTLANLQWAFTTGYFANWHPVTWLSHMLDCQLFGLNAGAHHLVSVLLHICNSLLLFLVLQRITGAVWRSAFVAALFAWHPCHVESVAWIAERKDLLSALFGILTIWAYSRYVEKRSPQRFLLSLVFFALGLMSKPMLVTWPFVLLLLDYWPLERFKNNKISFLFLEKIPFFVLSIASSIVTFLVQRQLAVISLEKLPLTMRIAHAAIAYVVYIGKMVWPVNLAIFYPHPGEWPVLSVTAAVVLLIIISFWVAMHARRKPYIVVGWLWFLGTLVPVIGLVQVGRQAWADRYTYIPFIGLFIVIAWSVPAFLQKFRFKTALILSLALVVLSGCMALTHLQVSHWKNSLTVFEHALRVTTNNLTAHINFGEALGNAGRLDEAVSHWFAALRINPEHAVGHYNLGLAFAEKGNVKESMEHYRAALKLKPDYMDAHYNLANSLQSEQKFDEAEIHYRETLRLKPDHIDALNNLGITLIRQDKTEEAILCYQRVLELAPNHLTHFLLAEALTSQNKIENAIIHYRKALHLNPDFLEALNNLALILATHNESRFRNGPEAVKLAEKATELNMNSNPVILNTLAAAYAESGIFNKANEVSEKSLVLAISLGDESLVQTIKERIELYQVRLPFHQRQSQD